MTKRNTKTYIKFIVAVVAIITSILIIGNKTVYAEDIFSYEIIQEENAETGEKTNVGIKITNFNVNNNTDVLIPETIEGLPVKELDSYLFRAHSEIETITIPDSVTTIGWYCFSECKNLKKIELSNNLETISEGLFIECTSLSEITIPESVTYIADSAFSSCKALESIKLPNGIKSVNTQTFSNCTKLKTVELPASVSMIRAGAFNRCESLENIILPAKVLEIGEEAFWGCSSLKEINIPYSVKTIAKATFYNCDALSNVTFDVSAESYNLGQNYLTSIANNAFYGCRLLKRIKFPNQLENIGEGAFAMTGLTEINLPKSIRTVGNNAFLNCYNCEKLILNEGLVTIGANAFDGFTKVEMLTIPSTVESIGNSAFRCWYGLTVVKIPKNVVRVGTEIFDMCYYLEKIELDCGSTLKASNFGQLASKVKQHSEKIVVDNGIINYICSMCNKKLRASVTLPKAQLAAVEYTGTGAKIKWIKNADANGYYIYRSVNGGSYSNIKIINGNSTTSFTDTNITVNGAKYTYKIYAYKTINSKKYMGAASVEKTIYHMSAPALKSVKNVEKGATLEWTKNPYASGYIIYRSANGGSYSEIKTITGASVVSYNDIGAIENGCKYQYKLVAYKTVNGTNYNSVYSSEKFTYILSKPVISSVRNNANRKVTVKWKKNTKASGYEIKYVTGKTTKTVKITSAAKVSKVLSSLKKGKTYKISIRAYKTVDGIKYYSAWSTQKSVKVKK